MARRSDHSRDEIKQMAILKGVEIIREHGLKELSARKLATAIGYTVGTLYNVFQNHDDIVVHINAATLDVMTHNIAQLSSELTQAPTLEEAIRLLSFSYLAFAKQEYHLWNSVFEHDISKDDLPSWYQDKTGALFGVIESLLLAKPTCNPQEASTHAKVLWASIHGICSLSMNGKLALLDAAPVETLIETFLGNYKLLSA
ncbi:MAG: TetR/AcrR family transcriptional regulator [Rickettsiales bacterium]|nr:TetR/AcrR family transcriptional regulator [Rickettsiales bacterium]